MEKKTISIKVSDTNRFFWGMNEFFPEAKVSLTKVDDFWYDCKVIYIKTEHRDPIAGYCKGHELYEKLLKTNKES